MPHPKSVVIFTSVHNAFDTRIYERQAKALVDAGYQVTLVAPGIDSHLTSAGIKIIGVPKPKRRLGRVLNWAHFFRIARAEQADIYHFHDPDLLLVGLLLQIVTGRPVIYDRHENYPDEFLVKEWIPKPLRYLTSVTFKWLERSISDRLSAVVVVVDEHRDGFKNVVTLHNYPSFADFLELPNVPKDPHKLIYLGGLGETYGAQNLVKMLALLDNEPIHLEWCGHYREDQAEVEINQLISHYGVAGKFHIHGQIPYSQVKEHLATALAGLVLLQDIPAYAAALPRKMFEYMACELPVIATNLRGISSVITGADCGILVEPDNPHALAQAVTHLCHHPDEANRLGKNGRKAVMEKYNWTHEAKKLVDLYESLLS